MLQNVNRAWNLGELNVLQALYKENVYCLK